MSSLEHNLCDQHFGRSSIHSMQAEYQLTERVQVEIITFETTSGHIVIASRDASFGRAVMV